MLMKICSFNTTLVKVHPRSYGTSKGDINVSIQHLLRFIALDTETRIAYGQSFNTTLVKVHRISTIFVS